MLAGKHIALEGKRGSSEGQHAVFTGRHVVIEGETGGIEGKTTLSENPSLGGLAKLKGSCAIRAGTRQIARSEQQDDPGFRGLVFRFRERPSTTGWRA